MARLTVRHTTLYRYRQPVAFGEHRILFRPRDSYDQRLIDSNLVIEPAPKSLHWMHDVFGNCVAIACFSGRSDRLRFESTITLDHMPETALQFPVAAYARRYPFSYDQEDMPDLLRSIERQYPDRNNELMLWARRFTRNGGQTSLAHNTGSATVQDIGTLDLLVGMTRTIKREFTYVRREEMGIQTPLETLKLHSGSCRDFALLMMEAVRALGFAARFVTGYLYSPPRESGDGHTGGGSTHAWVQVYIPGAGWMEFDPTNGIVGSHDLIRVGVARDPSQAVPLWGNYTGFPSDSLGLTVEVEVTAEAGSPASRAEPTSGQGVNTATKASSPRQ
jgi:transglutaminase-like putative cysteine protease